MVVAGQKVNAPNTIALAVLPIFNRASNTQAMPIVLVTSAPMQVVVTASGPSTPSFRWGHAMPITQVFMGGQRTIHWTPPVIGLSTFSVLIRAGEASATSYVVGPPEGTEKELSGTFAGYDAWAPRRFLQVAFAVRVPQDKVVNSGVKGIVTTASQIAGARPLLYRLWGRSKREGGVALETEFVLHLEFVGAESDRLTRAIEQALSLAGASTSVKLVNSGGRE